MYKHPHIIVYVNPLSEGKIMIFSHDTNVVVHVNMLNLEELNITLFDLFVIFM